MIGPIIKMKRQSRNMGISPELSLMEIKWHKTFCGDSHRLNGTCISCVVKAEIKHDIHEAPYNGGTFFWSFKK